MHLLPKYKELREQIQHGDIVLFRGKGLVSTGIQWLDKAYYSHAGLVFIAGGRRLVLDSNGPGVHPDFLSLRIANGHTDFCILRPKAWSNSIMEHAIEIIMERSDKGIAYDFGLIIQIALFRLTGAKQNFRTRHSYICSEFVREYTKGFNPMPLCYLKPNMPTTFITPWDLLIYADKNLFDILFDDSNKNKFRKATNG